MKSTPTPDWFFHRYFAAASILIAGLVFDWGWDACALSWIVVAGGFLIWSIADNEARR